MSITAPWVPAHAPAPGVGWVERSETHWGRFDESRTALGKQLMGFAALYPSYAFHRAPKKVAGTCPATTILSKHPRALRRRLRLRGRNVGFAAERHDGDLAGPVGRQHHLHLAVLLVQRDVA